MGADKEYIKIIRGMSPQQRLEKCLQLSDLTKQLFLTGLRNRYPHLDDREIMKIYIERIQKCSRQNY